jgi:hypothetical protein
MDITKKSKAAAEIVRPISDSSFYNYRVHSTSSVGHHRLYRIQTNKDVGQWVGTLLSWCYRYHAAIAGLHAAARGRNMGFQLTTLIINDLGAYFQPLHLQIVTGSSLIHVIYLTKQHHEHVHPTTCPDLHETGRYLRMRTAVVEVAAWRKMWNPWHGRTSQREFIPFFSKLTRTRVR